MHGWDVQPRHSQSLLMEGFIALSALFAAAQLLCCVCKTQCSYEWRSLRTFMQADSHASMKSAHKNVRVNCRQKKAAKELSSLLCDLLICFIVVFLLDVNIHHSSTFVNYIFSLNCLIICQFLFLWCIVVFILKLCILFIQISVF